MKAFLHVQGVNHLGRLILTTGEAGTGGGVPGLMQEVGVSQLFTSDARSRSAAFHALESQFDRTPDGHEVMHLNDTVGCWQVLHPGPGDSFPRADDNALVLRGQFYKSHILFLADLGRNGQSALLARTNDLQADIVITGLPAQGEALCDALIQAAQPKVLVVVDADYPVPRRAPAQLKERLARAGVPVIYTRTAGAVTIVERPGGWELSTMDGQHFRS